MPVPGPNRARGGSRVRRSRERSEGKGPSEQGFRARFTATFTPETITLFNREQETDGLAMIAPGAGGRIPARRSDLARSVVNTLPWKIQAKTETLGLIALLKP